MQKASANARLGVLQSIPNARVAGGHKRHRAPTQTLHTTQLSEGLQVRAPDKLSWFFEALKCAWACAQGVLQEGLWGAEKIRATFLGQEKSEDLY